MTERALNPAGPQSALADFRISRQWWGAEPVPAPAGAALSATGVRRRRFLQATAGTLASLSLSLYARQDQENSALAQSQDQNVAPQKPAYPVKALSSANGLEATRKAYELLNKGTDTLDASIEAINLVEDDPDDMTVGYGGLPNEEGIVELDAAVMHGPTHRAGAVAALQGIRYPARVAKLVLEQSDHVLLVGPGALRFAQAHGFQQENLLSEKARRIWLYWRQTLSPHDDWLPPADDELDPDVAKFFHIEQKRKPKSSRTRRPRAAGDGESSRTPKYERPTGTIHFAAMNGRGEISGLTSTSGLAFKMPGRVGDSAIIGAGLYVDRDVGSCGSTGRGEANLQNLSSFAAVELMRQGMSPQDAGMEVLRRIARSTESRLLDDGGRPNFNVKFYLLAKDGTHAGVALWGPAQLAVTDSQGTRLEECATLYGKKT